MSRGRRRKGRATVFSLLILMATTAVMFLLLIGVVGSADLIQDFRGVPEPRDFDMLIISSMFFGLAIDFVVMIYGVGYAVAFWLRYTKPFGYQLCLKCGYDLRGTRPQTCVCPECGRRNEPFLDPEEMRRKFGVSSD